MEREDVNPKSWGPVAWAFLDSVVLSYPILASYKDQIWMIDFMNSLSDALPCETCRTNFKIFMNQNPIRLNVMSRDAVKKWLEAYKKWSTFR